MLVSSKGINLKLVGLFCSVELEFYYYYNIVDKERRSKFHSVPASSYRSHIPTVIPVVVRLFTYS